MTNLNKTAELSGVALNEGLYTMTEKIKHVGATVKIIAVARHDRDSHMIRKCGIIKKIDTPLPDIITNIPQGTEEWRALRRGIPTASEFGKILTARGKPSEQAATYMRKLAAARITGREEDGYSNGWMREGNEREAESRAFYEFESGNRVIEVSFVFGPGRRYGCSPDGLVMDGGRIIGGLELKNRSPHVHIEHLEAGKIPTSALPQVMGCLLVTGAEWWDYVSYCPGLRPLISRVYRDDVDLSTLRDALDGFCDGLDALVSRISGTGPVSKLGAGSGYRYIGRLYHPDDLSPAYLENRHCPECRLSWVVEFGQPCPQCRASGMAGYPPAT